MPTQSFQLCFTNFDESSDQPSDEAFMPSRTQTFAMLDEALDAAETPANPAFPYPWIRGAHLLPAVVILAAVQPAVAQQSTDDPSVKAAMRFASASNGGAAATTRDAQPRQVFGR